jgi:hypothetical protein
VELSRTTPQNPAEKRHRLGTIRTKIRR